VLDSSFLFVPIGNDLLIVAMVARHHGGLPFYAISGACGSAVGVLLVDLLVRRMGAQGVERVAGKRRFNFLKRKIGENGGKAIALATLAPPPFPFTLVVAVTVALGYPRQRLLWLVGICRAVRFTLLGLLAIRYGRRILQFTNMPAFKWSMVAFIVLCLVGSAFSIKSWIRSSRSRGEAPAGVSQPA
jgi:uncharacterized membrane protein YdjX (TVP38/TMEM64 family)